MTAGCEVGGCRWLPLCESCEQAEMLAAAKHVWGEPVTSPVVSRWEENDLDAPDDVLEYVQGVLAEAAGVHLSGVLSGSARPMNPERGDDCVSGKGGRPGVGPSDSQPADNAGQGHS